MTTGKKIRDEKLQYDINREAAKISASSSGKIDKYEFIIGEEMFLSDQNRITEEDMFTNSLLSKIFEIEKQLKTNEDKGKKQVEVLKTLKPEENQPQESIKVRIKTFSKKMRINETKKHIYDFH